jgi:hypothetical protein
MEVKYRNERVINLTFKYNSKKTFFSFTSNINEFPINEKTLALNEKMVALCLSQENAVFYRMLLRAAFKINDKKDKKYFDKINKAKFN